MRKKSLKNNKRIRGGSRENSTVEASQLYGVFDRGGGTMGATALSQPWQMMADSQVLFLTLNRVALSYIYASFGIVQTIIDQPIEDAFRGGIIIECEELDADDIDSLQQHLHRSKYIETVKDAMKWARLYGGSGLIINTSQNPALPLNKELIGEKTPLSFIDADRWELAASLVNFETEETPYNYYGEPLHRTRVIRINGKRAPSFIRQRLQGWGMSDIERLMRDVNLYLKEQDVIYELIDEAKIDIFKISGFNSSMLNVRSAEAVRRRFELANQTKNYQNSVAMDSEDDYEQKQMTFTGLAEMLQQVRIGMAAAARFPLTKLFGLSAAGFNSGEDDIENYNAMVESEVREKAKHPLLETLPMIVKQLFGFYPENINVKFHPLRVLGADAEETVKTSKQNRASQLYHDDIITGVEYDQILRKEGLLSIKTEVSEGLREPEKKSEEVEMGKDEANNDK